MAFSMRFGNAQASQRARRLPNRLLERYRPLAAYKSQRHLEAIFGGASVDLLTRWNAAATFEQAVHPQRLLAGWVGGKSLRPEPADWGAAPRPWRPGEGPSAGSTNSVRGPRGD